MADPQETSDLLTQAEVDALLASTKTERPGGVKATRPFEFQKPDFLSAEKLRRIRAKHDGLIHTLNSTLSLFLRKNFSLRISRLETITHVRLVDALPELTHMAFFRPDPLNGIGLLETSSQLGLSIVSRMLGSNSYAVKGDRPFTEIELRLLNQFLEVVLREYASLWRPYEQQLTIALAGHESNPRFLKLGAPDALMFFLAMEAHFGETTGFIRIAVPYAILEPLINRMVTDAGPPASGTAAASTIQIQEPVLNVPISISAKWQGLQLTVAELRRMQKDDVFMIDQNILTRTAIHLGDVLKFFGQVGRRGDRLAVRITSKN